MKKLLLVLITATTMMSCGTIKSVEYGDGFLLEDQAVNSLTKKENYILANEWLVEAFNNAESVIQFSDKEAGIVKGKYNLYSGWSYNYWSTPKYSATITLRVKDNAVKIEIDTRGTKFKRWVGTGIYQGGPVDGQGYTNVHATADKKALILSFKNRLQK